MKEPKKYAQNSAQVFNRGKRLRFPIGVQTTKQLSADQRADARSSEAKLLDAFKGLSETLRGVAVAEHSKKANKLNEARPLTQNIAVRPKEEPADVPMAVAGEGPDAEAEAPRVKMEPPDLPTVRVKMPYGSSLLDPRTMGILKNEKDQDTGGSLPHDDPAKQKRKPEPIPKIGESLPVVVRNEPFRHPFGPAGTTPHPINMTGHGIGTGSLQVIAEAKDEDIFDGGFDGEVDFTEGRVSKAPAKPYNHFMILIVAVFCLSRWYR